MIDLLPKSNLSNASSIKSDSDLLHHLELSQGPLDYALSYKHNGYTEFLGSGAECVFNAVEMEDLKHFVATVYITALWNRCHHFVSVMAVSATVGIF